MLTTTQFKVWFPEFANISDEQVDAKIIQSSFEFQFSDRFELPNVADYGQALFTAHLLSLPSTSVGSSSVSAPPGTVIKRIRSRNEEIEYDVSGAAAADTDVNALEGTTYGLRLLDMIQNYYMGAWLV